MRFPGDAVGRPVGREATSETRQFGLILGQGRGFAVQSQPRRAAVATQPQTKGRQTQLLRNTTPPRGGDYSARDRRPALACLDLIDRGRHGIEGQQRGRMPGLIIAHRLEHGNIRPLAVGGAPFSFSMRRTVSRRLRSSSAFAPTTWRAMIEEEAWPARRPSRQWQSQSRCHRPSSDRR